MKRNPRYLVTRDGVEVGIYPAYNGVEAQKKARKHYGEGKYKVLKIDEAMYLGRGAAETAARERAERRRTKAAESTRTVKRRRNAAEKDTEHPIEVTRHYRSGPPGYLSQWQRAMAMGQEELFPTGIALTARASELRTSRQRNPGLNQRVYQSGLKEATANQLSRLARIGLRIGHTATQIKADLKATGRFTTDQIARGVEQARAAEKRRRNGTHIHAEVIDHLDVSKVHNPPTRKMPVSKEKAEYLKLLKKHAAKVAKLFSLVAEYYYTPEGGGIPSPSQVAYAKEVIATDYIQNELPLERRRRPDVDFDTLLNQEIESYQRQLKAKKDDPFYGYQRMPNSTRRNPRGTGLNKIAFTVDKRGKTLAYRYSLPAQRWFRIGVEAARLQLSTGQAIEVDYNSQVTSETMKRPYTSEWPLKSKLINPRHNEYDGPLFDFYKVAVDTSPNAEMSYRDWYSLTELDKLRRDVAAEQQRGHLPQGVLRFEIFDARSGRLRPTGKFLTIDPKSRRNPTGSRKVRKLYEDFSGRKARKQTELSAPDGTPAQVAKLGRLRLIRTTDGRTWSFRGSQAPYLAADARGKMHVVGGAYKANPVSTQAGEIDRIEYETSKPHLGQRKRSIYYHQLGEETGKRPMLEIDRDGLLKIRGGAYRLEADGIHN
jgi:hypothetical protein